MGLGATQVGAYFFAQLISRYLIWNSLPARIGKRASLLIGLVRKGRLLFFVLRLLLLLYAAFLTALVWADGCLGAWLRGL